MDTVSLDFMMRRHPYVYAYNEWMNANLSVEEAVSWIVKDPDFQIYCAEHGIEDWGVAYHIVTVAWTKDYMEQFMEPEDPEE